ncbi:MAG: hypothetical protein P8L85_18180 [Rubripirellula sp.]|nr:hypothetical protein [Rubripirellula sp.]
MGKYDVENRSIVLDAELDSDPSLGLATLVNGVVNDLLYQNRFAGPVTPEVAELAVVGTGLGTLRNGIGLVGKVGSHWDSTRWEIAARPFLDFQTLAYANAIAAWARDDRTPAWVSEMHGELKRPMQNSLKFLFKTNDSFFQPTKQKTLLGQPQDQWWELAAIDSASQKVIAIRHLQTNQDLSEKQQTLLLEHLDSPNRAIVLHAIATVERMAMDYRPIANEAIVGRLRILADHRDDEISAKAMCTVTRLKKLDENTIDIASNMLESQYRHVIYAGAYAFSSLDSIPDHVLKLVDRAFVRALQACDYEFVGMFALAYKRWLDDPEAHLQDLLQDSPEYLPVALDALNHEPDQVVSIG